jgi:hypothetical protein
LSGRWCGPAAAGNVGFACGYPTFVPGYFSGR